MPQKAEQDQTELTEPKCIHKLRQDTYTITCIALHCYIFPIHFISCKLCDKCSAIFRHTVVYFMMKLTTFEHLQCYSLDTSATPWSHTLLQLYSELNEKETCMHRLVHRCYKEMSCWYLKPFQNCQIQPLYRQELDY